MRNVMVVTILYTSFFPTIFAAEPKNNQSPFIARNQQLGDTGASSVPLAPKPNIKPILIFSDAFLKGENLRVSPRDRQKPGSKDQLKPGYYKPTQAPELSNPPVKK